MIRALTLTEVQQLPAWQHALCAHRKDHRFYELAQTLLEHPFEHGYFLITDRGRSAIQPFFVLDQDMFQGAGAALIAQAERLRNIFPRFAKMRTLMVGNVAGEGSLDCAAPDRGLWIGQELAVGLLEQARQMRCAMAVMKEFPSKYRIALADVRQAGFFRMPSMPMVKLDIDYPSFDAYMAAALSKTTRKNLRRKFKATAGKDITLDVVTDLTPFVEEAYPLYLAVYERSALHFEKLNRPFLCELGRRMPDKARFFLWRMAGKLIAFSIILLHGDSLFDEYLGMDYSVALDLHLYFHTLRDIVQWAINHGYKHYCSSALNYEPKLHLKCALDPLDLYVAHTSDAANFIMSKVLPLVAPTNADAALPKFANFGDLWGEP